MEQSRREFTKKAAIVTAGAVVATGTSVLATTGESSKGDKNNGVVKGSSRKKEILYKETAAWEEYYKQAK